MFRYARKILEDGYKPSENNINDTLREGIVNETLESASNINCSREDMIYAYYTLGMYILDKEDIEHYREIDWEEQK